MDYAMVVSLALYGLYAFMDAKALGRDRRALRVIVTALVVILTYTALRIAFIKAGIQPQ